MAKYLQGCFFFFYIQFVLSSINAKLVKQTITFVPVIHFLKG